MLVSEVMSRDVQVARLDQTIQQAATMMSEMDVGALPVAQDDRLVGMITDRDIAIRAVAENEPPSTKVRDVMTVDTKFCFDHEDADQVARNMGEKQVRRLLVVNRDRQLVGILALADLAKQGSARLATQALQGISLPGGPPTRAIS
jgi:CBS domain-containing protein